MRNSLIATAASLPMLVLSHQGSSLASPASEPTTDPTVRTRVHVTTVELALEQLIRDSDEIVLARATKRSNSTWCSEFATTDFTFSVIDRCKGADDAEITVKIAGGTTGDVTTIVPDAPEFQVGDTAVLFLQRFEGLDERFLVGLAQGVYRVAEEFAVPLVRGRWAENEPLDSFLERVNLSASIGAGR